MANHKGVSPDLYKSSPAQSDFVMPRQLRIDYHGATSMINRAIGATFCFGILRRFPLGFFQ
jgi:hypothetical protein